MLAYDIMFRHDYQEPDRDRMIAALANIDWARTNRDWFGMIGVPEQDSTGAPVLDEEGRERVVIMGGKGDQGLRRAIGYLRKKAGVRRLVDANELDLEVAETD